MNSVPNFIKLVIFTNTLNTILEATSFRDKLMAWLFMKKMTYG